MIFSEQDLHIGTNAFDIINESAWIDGGSIISPRTIALVESNSVGGYVVRFNDIEALSEEYGIDYIDSMLAIAEVNGIDPQYLAVAVNESDIIINPELVYELANVITVPISRNSTAYQFCEACIDGYMNTGDEGYLTLLVEEDDFLTYDKVKNASIDDFYKQYPNRGDAEKAAREFLVKDHPDNAKTLADFDKKYANFNFMRSNALDDMDKDDYYKVMHISSKLVKDKNLGNAMAVNTKMVLDQTGMLNTEKGKNVVNAMNNILMRAEHAPKSWIGKKIAALRGLYRRYLDKAELEHAAGKAGIFKTIAMYILKAIDALTRRLQKFAG